MAYTPTHAVSRSLDNLRNTLAASATFRALTGTSTHADALQRILFPKRAYAINPATTDSPERQLAVPRPRAIVKLAEGWMLQSLGVGNYAHICPLYMGLEIQPPEAVGDEPIKGDGDAEWLWFGDAWFAIVSEMATLMRAGVDGDGNTMLACQSEPRIVQQPDAMEEYLDVIDEEWYGIGLVWTVQSGR